MAHRGAVPSSHEDPFVRAGPTKIQATPSRVAFVVAEPDGSGLVPRRAGAQGLSIRRVRAAPRGDPTRSRVWTARTSEGVSRHRAADARRGLFQLRHATYTVAPPVYAMQQDTGSSIRRTVVHRLHLIGFQQNVFGLWRWCDPFFSPCIGKRTFHHRGRPLKHLLPRRPARSALDAGFVRRRDSRDEGRAGVGSCARRRLPATARSNPCASAARCSPNGRVSRCERASRARRPALASARHDPRSHPPPVVGAPVAPASGRVVSLTSHPHVCGKSLPKRPRAAFARPHWPDGLTTVRPAPASRTLASRREALDAQATDP